MPQFDTSNFSSQIFWLIICFAILYTFVKYYFIPNIRNILENRDKYIFDINNKISSLNNNINSLNLDISNIKKDADNEYYLKINKSLSENKLKNTEKLYLFKDDMTKKFSLAKKNLLKEINDLEKDKQDLISDISALIIKKFI